MSNLVTTDEHISDASTEVVISSIDIQNTNNDNFSTISPSITPSIPATPVHNSNRVPIEPVLAGYGNNEHNYATNNLVHTSNSQFLSIKDAINLIPVFNGENMPVNNFIELCNQTLNLIHPSGKLYLTQLIKSRILGKASKYISNQSGLAFEGILGNLKRALVPSRTLSQWQSLLSNIYQKDGETIVDYVTRINEIVQGTSEVIMDKHSGEIRTGLLASTQEGARDSFVRGLRGELGLWAASQKPLTLSRAVDLAVELEKELEQRNSLFKIHSHCSNNPYSSQYSISSSQNHIKFANNHYGDRRNHNNNRLPQESSTNNQATVRVTQTHNNDNIRRLDRNSIICFSCGGRGHYKKTVITP